MTPKYVKMLGVNFMQGIDLQATNYKLRFNLDTPRKLHWKVAGIDWALASITVDYILNYVGQIKRGVIF